MKKIILGILICCVTQIPLKANRENWDYARNLLKFTQALTQQAKGNPKEAKHLYEELLKAGAPLQVYGGLLRLYEQIEDYHKIAALAPLLEKTFAKEPDILLLFARAFRNIGQHTESNKRIVQLSTQFPDNQEIVLNAVEAFLQLKEPENALKAINKLLEADVRNINKHVFHFLQAQVHMRMLDYPKALASLEEALTLNPSFQRAYLLKAMIQEQKGKTLNLLQLPQGHAGFIAINTGNSNSTSTSKTSTQSDVKNHVLQLILSNHKDLNKDLDKNLDKNSGANNSSIGLDKQDQKDINKLGKLTDKEECFRSALTMLEIGNHEQSLTLVNQCLTIVPDNLELRLLKVEVLISMRKMQDAINTLALYLKEDPTHEIWYEALNALAPNDVSPNTIIKTFEAIYKDQPKNELATMYLAHLYLQKKALSQAIVYLQKTFELTKDPQIKSKVLFQIGAIYYERQAYDKLPLFMKHAEKLNSSFAPLLNLIAYYHATEGRNLDKADLFLKKALRTEPNNPHYLDTNAVILYKKGNYQDALALLERISNTPKMDATIYIHLAKTYHRLGRKSDAVTAAQKAQTVAANNYEREMATKLLTSWANETSK